MLNGPVDLSFMNGTLHRLLVDPLLWSPFINDVPRESFAFFTFDKKMSFTYACLQMLFRQVFKV